MPKVSEVYGTKRAKFLPKKEEPVPQVRSEISASMLCQRGTSIWLNHRYGPSWICKRCGFQVDLKKLLGK